MSEEVFSGLVIGGIATIVVILGILLGMSVRRRRLAQTQNRLLTEQITAQQATAQAVESLGEEESTTAVPTTSTSAATPANGHVATSAAPAPRRNPHVVVLEGRMTAAEEQVRQLMQRSTDPFAQEMEEVNEDFAEARSEYRIARKEGKVVDKEIQIATQRMIRERKSRRKEELENQLLREYGPRQTATTVTVSEGSTPASATETTPTGPTSRTHQLTINGQAVRAGQDRVNIPNGHIILTRQGTDIILTVHPDTQGASVSFRGGRQLDLLRAAVTMDQDRTVTVTITSSAAAATSTQGAGGAVLPPPTP